MDTTSRSADLATTMGTKIAQSLVDGWQMPSQVYSDPSYYAIERASIFNDSWHYVCRTEQLAHVGDYVTDTLGDTPILIVRDRDGSLRGHVNICLHRLHPVAEGSGCKKLLQCRYHGWTYGLDGALKNAPRQREEKNFDTSDFKLREISVATLGNFVFANPNPTGQPFAEYIGPGAALLETLDITLDGWEPGGPMHYDVEGNWKLFVENTLECYHCPLVHNGTYASIYDTDNAHYISENFENVATQLTSVHSTPSADTRAKDNLKGMRLLFIWPFTFISADDYGGLALRVEPTGPQTCRFVGDAFINPTVERAAYDEWAVVYDATFKEDKTVVAAQQAGYNAGRVEQGRLMPQSESSIVMFQRRTWAAISAATGR